MRRLFILAVFMLAGCIGVTQPPAPGPAPELTPAPSIFPPGWVEVAPGRWKGSPLVNAWAVYRSWDGASLDSLCMSEANRGRPQAYGPAPEIRIVMLGGHAGCFILPSGGAATAALLLPLPPRLEPGTLLALFAPRREIEVIGKGLVLPEVEPEPEPACDFSPWTGQPRYTRGGDRLVIEFDVARGANCTPLSAPVEFAEHVKSGEAAAALNQLEQGQASPARLKAINTRLAPFGYQVETYGERLFRIHNGGEEVRANLSWLGQLTISSDGSRFLFPVVDAYNALSLILEPGGVRSFEHMDLLVYDRVFPVLVSESEVGLQYDLDAVPRPAGDPGLLNVLQDGKKIDTLAVSGSSPAGGPARGLWAWQEHWLLELPGLIIQDGEILNDSLGCSEMFGWQLIREQPFYFCRKSGQVHIVSGEYDLPLAYDEVLYAPQVGARMLAQMRRYDQGMAFFARRAGTWIYVLVE